MKFRNRYLPDLTQAKEYELYEKYIHQAGDPEIHNGVYETIKALHDEWHKLFVLSGDPPSKLLPEVERWWLTNFFTKIVWATHDKTIGISLIIDEFHLDKDQTFFVGDTSGEVGEGKAAWVKTIGISRWYQSRKWLDEAEADFVIDDIIEILGVIAPNL